MLAVYSQDITPDSTLNVRVWYKTKQEREDQLVAWGTATFTEIYQRRSSTSFGVYAFEFDSRNL